MQSDKNGDKKRDLSRKDFLKNTGALAAGLSLAGGLAIGAKPIFGAPGGLRKRSHPDSFINGVQIGAVTYSYRSLADQSAEGLLENIVDSGVSAIELMSGPAERFAGKPEDPKQVAQWRASVSMDKFKELRCLYNGAGVQIYEWKPDVFGEDNSDAEINYGFNVAKALGAKACTTEHPGNDRQTKRLGDIAAQHETFISYHAHTQATPTLWNTALKQSDYNAINLDAGHYVAAGNPDVLEFIGENHDRITSIHLKDRTTPAHGQKNLPFGQGDTPITEILQLMRGQDYRFPASIELEYEIPEGSDAVKEVSRCLDFCREALND